MKKLLLTLVTIALLTASSFAQVAINTNGADPNASAILDLSSTNKGLLIPRMTTNNRTTNITPVGGLLVYDTDTESFWYYDGTQLVWTEIKAGSALDINSLSDGSSDGTSVFLGDSCGNADVGNNYNVAIGIKALKNNDEGEGNVAIGNAALANSYHRSDLVAIGDSALYNNGNDGAWSVYGLYNTAVGASSLFSNSRGSQNTAIGYQSIYSASYAFRNTAIGFKSIYSNTSGDNNTAIGSWSLFSNTEGDDNTAIGRSSLAQNTTGNENTATGMYSLLYHKSGDNNTANGYEALFYDTIGHGNTAIGSRSLYRNRNGKYNTALGVSSLDDNTSGDYNTAIGVSSMGNNTSADYNTAIGYHSLASDTTGDRNSATGTSALYSNRSGSLNTANGYRSLFFNTTANSNVAMGSYSLYKNTDRSNLVAIGDSALYNNGDGASSSLHANHNTAIGSKSSYANTTGYDNTSLGYRSSYSNTVGTYNTAIGSFALSSNLDGENNTATGSSALYKSQGDGNTADGNKAMYENTSGEENVATGNVALYNNTTGNNNVAIGSATLYGNYGGSSNTAIGYRAGFNLNGSNANGCIYIGNEAGYYNSSDDKLFIANSSTTNPLIGGDFSASQVDINGTIKITGGSPSNGKVLTTDDYGNASWQDTENYWASSGGVIYNLNSAGVGIGTELPNTKLHVKKTSTVNNINPLAIFESSGSGNSACAIRTQNSAGNKYNFGITPDTDNAFEIAYDNNIGMGSGIFRITQTGNVSLDGTIKIEGGNPGSGKVLTSNAVGLASWETFSLNNLSDAITDGSSIFVGDQVGVNDDGTNYNTVLGDEAFKTNTSGQHNTAFGYKTLENSNGGSNSAFGINSLRYNTSGSYNTAVGMAAISYNETGDNNTAIGYNAGLGSSGNSFSGCVFLGYEAGKNNSNNNKLFIANSDDATPLIGGDFSTDELYFNASKVGIGTDNPNEILEVTGTPGNTARMIVSDGNGSSRKVILFVSPSASYNYARIDAYDYGTTSGKTLKINTVGDGDVIIGGDVVPEAHKSKNLGSSTKAWDNVYGDDFLNMGAAAFSDINVTKQLISFPPQEKKAGAFDEFTDKGLKELDPASLPKELTEDNALLIDEMTTYNYKANYEQQIQIENLKKENYELKIRLEKLEKLIEGLKQ